MPPAGEIHTEVLSFLDEEGLPAAWEKLRRTFKNAEGRRRAFHGWFDGLRTLRLIHHLSAAGYGRCGPERGVEELLRWAGFPCTGIAEEDLEILRRHQNVDLPTEFRVCLNRLIHVG